MENGNVIFFRSFWNTYKMLPDKKVANEYIIEILRYSFEGDIASTDPVVLALMESAKPVIDSAKTRYAKSIMNGGKGGRPRNIDYEQVISLRDEGYSQNEISAILKISIRQVVRILSSYENNRENRQSDITDKTLKDMSRHNLNKDKDRDKDRDKDIDMDIGEIEMPF